MAHVGVETVEGRTLDDNDFFSPWTGSVTPAHQNATKRDLLSKGKSNIVLTLKTVETIPPKG
jgi:hypothetical protein